MKTTLALISACLLFVGCDRFRRMDLDDYPELVGNFEWTESLIDSTTIKTPVSTGQQYRFSITKKGKVCIYKDNKPESKGYVYKIQLLEEGHLHIRMMLDNKKEFSMFFDGETELYSSNYPYVAIRNVFVKQ